MRSAIIAVLLLNTGAVMAQHGTAQTGYYPANYDGATFTGTVTASDPEKDAISLEYKKGSKTESLPFYLEGGCSVPSTNGEKMHAKNIPPGTVITAYYKPTSEKRDGKKETVNATIAISILEWQGRKVEKEHVYPCGEWGFTKFRSW